MRRSVVILFFAALAVSLFAPSSVPAQDSAPNAATETNPAAEDGEEEAEAEDEVDTEDSGLEVDVLKDAATGLVKSDSKKLTKFSLERVLGFFKMLAVLAVFLCWVATADWVNRDLWERKAGKGWNLGMIMPFAAAFQCWPLPYWSIYFPILLAGWLVPTFIYIAVRNPKVEEDKKVFSAQHWRRITAAVGAKFGMKISTEAPNIDDIGPPIKLSARGAATDRDNNVNLMTARHGPGYLPARELLHEAFETRSGSLLLDYTAQAVGVRFMLDGVMRPGEARDRETGDAILVVFKALANLNPAERRAPQSGAFGAEYGKTKYTCKIISQGTQTGERVLLTFDDGTSAKLRIPEMGMREKMIEELKAQLAEKTGLIIISAPPGHGLTTLYQATVALMDRYTRGFVAVEHAAKSEMTIENVPVTTFAQGETPATVLPKLIREYPDVIVVPEFVDAESAELLCDQMSESRMVVTTVRAKEASEALLRIMAIGMPAEKFASAARVVLNQRLVRKLCENCKEGYAPTPQVLQQLGIPAGRVEALYRPPTPNPEQPTEPCAKCQGVGYFGRTGIFELLIVTDEVREVLNNRPKIDAVRQAARKSGMRTLQEEGIVLVAKGVTSLAELMRVLKE